MSQLESSWNLKDTINSLELSAELKIEIDKYIERENKVSTGKAHSFSNIIYRCNLHYIIANKDKTGLLNELKIINN